MKRILLSVTLAMLFVSGVPASAGASDTGVPAGTPRIYCHANDVGDYSGQGLGPLPQRAGIITYKKNVMFLSSSAPTPKECHDLALAACKSPGQSTHPDDCWANDDDRFDYRQTRPEFRTPDPDSDGSPGS